MDLTHIERSKGGLKQSTDHFRNQVIVAIEDSKPANLAAGQFYGKVPQKRSVGSSILSEIVHIDRFDVPEHSHELAYFMLVLGGSYTERFGPQTKDHDPMTVLWHRAGISHKDRIGENGARCFTVEIRHRGMENLSQYSRVPHDFAEFGTPLVWLTTRLFREFSDWQNCSELVAEGLTLEMLGYIARRNDACEKHPPKWFGHVIDRLNEEFKETVSMHDLTEIAGVHPVHLASVFRKFRGQTIGEYVQQLRVSHASKLMIDRELPLADIAYEAGFSDQSHFNRLFKRHTGMTPGEFRRTVV